MKMKKKIFLAFLVFFAVFVFSIFLITYFAFYSLEQIVVKEMHVEVGSYVGFNLDDDKVYFGTVLPGGYSERPIFIVPKTNSHYYITSKGNISGFVCEKNHSGTELLKDVEYRVNICVSIPYEANRGVYEGDLYLYFFNKKPGFIQKLFLKGQPIKEFFKESRIPSISLNISE